MKKGLIKMLRKILKNSGFYFSSVTDKIVENQNNTVNVIFDVVLGEKAFIKKIQFIGDKVYKDRTLRGVIASEEDRFWKFITKDRFINPDLIASCFRVVLFFNAFFAIFAISFIE